MDVVDFAYQIINMQRRIKELECELQRVSKYEEEYRTILDGSIKHSETMMRNTIKMLLTPGVVDNLTESKHLWVEESNAN